MASEFPYKYNYVSSSSLKRTTEWYTQRLSATSTPGEYRSTLEQLYLFLKEEFGFASVIAPAPVNYIPLSVGNTNNRGEFVFASDTSTWYIDPGGRGILIMPAVYFEELGAVNNDVIVNTPLPDPADFDSEQINKMIGLYSGGTRLFYPNQFGINPVANQLTFPGFGLDGESVHLSLRKLFYP